MVAEVRRKLEKNTFLDILSNNKKLTQENTLELKTIISQYPYFQSARALYLKGLKNEDSFKYNKELKQTAAYTTDRTILFDFITSEEFNKSNNKIEPQFLKEEFASQKIDRQTTEEKVTESIQKAEKTLEIGKPISFSATEQYSFHQWLQLASKKPIQRVEKEEKLDKKEEIINQFIENNPKIEPLPKDKVITVDVSQVQQDAMLMTETLAKVYLEQKKYENAIQAYRILSLKYPEKSGFFADQIKKVEILQKHK